MEEHSTDEQCIIWVFWTNEYKRTLGLTMFVGLILKEKGFRIFFRNTHMNNFAILGHIVDQAKYQFNDVWLQNKRNVKYM